MLHPRLAGRYAKSLIDLALERNELAQVHRDMLFLQSVCKQSPEFVNLLRSPVVNAYKKESILTAITKGNISEMTLEFCPLLIRKGRESVLPEIISAFIEQYNKVKEIHIVKLTTAQPPSEALKQEIIKKIEAETPIRNIELQVEVNEELIGGFVLEFDGNLVDASVLRDLRDIQKQFRDNIYVRNIR